MAALLFLFSAGVYLSTASYDATQSMDTGAAAFAAWSLAEHGSFALNDVLDEPVGPPERWFTEVDGAIVTNRHLGVIAHGVPAYLVWSLFSDSLSLAPAGVAAALVTAGAVAIMYLVLCHVVTSHEAFAGALVYGFATSTWSVSADALWPHGPGQLWLALALLLIVSGRWLSGGVAYGIALLVRPPTAIMPAVQGLLHLWRQRRVGPAVALAVTGACAVGILLTYSVVVFGEPSLRGGYGEGFLQLKAGGGLDEVWWYLSQLCLALVSTRGLLVWSPFLVVLGMGLAAAWRTAPPWVRDAALAGLVYVLVHYWLNRYHGGDMFFAYRYPLEPLVMFTPLLALSYRNWVATRPRLARLFWVFVALSVGWHAFGAVFYARILPAIS